MKSKKILLIALMAIIVVIANIHSVYAAESFSVNLASDYQNYARGQTVEITVSLNNIVSNDGIYGIEGYLDYKTDVFEAIVSDGSAHSNNVVGLNSWLASFNPDPADEVYKNKLTAYTSASANSELSIIKISLIVKDDAPLGKTEILLQNIAGSSGDNGEDITTTPAAISVNITEASEEIPPITTEPEPEPVAEPTTEPSAIPSAQTIVTSPTPSSEKLPQTGLNNYVVIALIGALVIALVSYIAYRRYKDI